MSELPKGWVECAVGDVFTIVGGGTPSAGDPTNFAEGGTAHAWLTPADLSGYKLKKIKHGARDLSEKGLNSCSAKTMASGSVLFTSRAPIGYVAIADGEIATNQGFKSFIVPDGIDTSYLYYYLKSIRKLAESRGTGTTFKELSGAAVKKLPFVLAPFEEQKRIAAKLDELLAQVDALKARIDAIPALIKRLRHTISIAAISGKLITKQPTNKQWTQVAIGDLCQLRSGIAISPNLEKDAGDIPYFKVSEMNLAGNEMFLRHTNRWLMKDDASSRSILPLGSIVFPKRGGAIATNKKRILKQPAFVDLNIMGIIVPADTDPMYVFRWLETIDLGKLNTGSTIPQINNSDIAPLEIPLPPLEEQAEIAHRIEQLFAFADQLEAKVSAAKQHINNLTQSLLAKAFCGELVPQDPNDEPAGTLLAGHPRPTNCPG